jgi:hypothetical protein
VPFVVPTIPTFSLSTDLAAAAFRNVTPIQAGATSRIGSSIYATAPGGTVTLFTAWGFLAGQAPPGTSSLAVAASGLSMIGGNCYTPGGYARAYGDIFVVVEEFEPAGFPPRMRARASLMCPTPVSNTSPQIQRRCFWRHQSSSGAFTALRRSSSTRRRACSGTR